MGANQQMLLASSAKYTGVLDSYTTGLWSCWSMEKRLIGSYGLGPAINVRRSSDNATTDINLTVGGGLDTTALSAFAGAASCYVTKAYDQSGGGNHWLQATAANQPRIVNAGVLDNKIVFNPTGTATWLKTANTSSASVIAKTIFRKVNRRSLVNPSYEFEYGDGSLIGTASGASQFRLIDATSPNDFTIYFATTSGVGYRSVGYNSNTESNTVNGIIALRGQPSNSTMKWYQGGVLTTNTFTSDSGTFSTTGNFPGYFWSVGASSSGGNLGAAIDMWSCAVYDADKSADANAINTALA